MAVLGTVLGLGVLLMAVLAYHGLFSKVEVTEGEKGPLVFAYQDFVGDYKKTGPVFSRVNDVLNVAGIKPTLGIGHYLDNPSQVPQEQLRSKCGSVIDEKDVPLVSKLEGIKIGRMERKPSLLATMPVRSPLSYMLCPIKAYPALGAAAKKIGKKPMDAYEIYDMTQKQVFYVLRYE
jgi:hypothetical protein